MIKDTALVPVCEDVMLVLRSHAYFYIFVWFIVQQASYNLSGIFRNCKSCMAFVCNVGWISDRDYVIHYIFSLVEEKKWFSCILKESNGKVVLYKKRWENVVHTQTTWILHAKQKYLCTFSKAILFAIPIHSPLLLGCFCGNTWTFFANSVTIKSLLLISLFYTLDDDGLNVWNSFIFPFKRLTFLYMTT